MKVLSLFREKIVLKLFSKKIKGIKVNIDKPSRVKTTSHLQLFGNTIPYTLVQSRLARTVRFKISQSSGLEVVVPMRFNTKFLPEILDGKEEWILKHMTRLEHAKKQKFLLGEGAKLAIFGEEKIVRFALSQNLSEFVHDTGTELIIHMRTLATASALNAGQKVLEKYLYRRIKGYLETRTGELARLMGTQYRHVTIRAQKTRWGSCSRDNNINFNWRLIFFERAVIDYVIIHELAHTIHHNHSRRFYNLLEKFCPDYKVFRKKLKNSQPPM